MTDVRFNKTLIWLNALVPLALLGYDAARGQLGANPVEFFLRTTGVLTLLCLLTTLAITPLRKLTGSNQLIKYRRTIALFAFFYGCIHLSTYFVFDRGLSLSGTVADVIERPFVALGMAAFLMMVPLAATSTNAMIKRLGGKRWQRLHRLIYLTGILAGYPFLDDSKVGRFLSRSFRLRAGGAVGLQGIFATDAEIYCQEINGLKRVLPRYFFQRSGDNRRPLSLPYGTSHVSATAISDRFDPLTFRRDRSGAHHGNSL
jgi:Predicted membrane protein